MNDQHELRLRAWLSARDPGDVPSALRSAAAQVPQAHAAGHGLAGLIRRRFAPDTRASAWIPVIVALLLVVLIVIGAGLLVLRMERTPRFPPAGFIAYAALDQEIWVVNADGSGTRALTDTEDGEIGPRWSPDGRTLLFTRLSGHAPPDRCIAFTSSSLVLHDMAMATERVLLAKDDYLYAPAWSPDGRSVAYLDVDPSRCEVGELPRAIGGGVIDVASGAVSVMPSASGALWQEWVGASIAYLYDDRLGFADPAARDVASPNDVFTLGDSNWALPSDDGRYVALSKGLPESDDHMQIADRTTGRRVDLGVGLVGAWSPVGGSIAFLGLRVWEGSTEERSLMVASAPGWEPRAVGRVTIEYKQVMNGQVVPDVPDLAWTSDGRTVYWRDDNDAHDIEVASGKVVELPPALENCVDFQWQPMTP